MPRVAREKSKTGIYHVIVRGINRQDIFHDEEDYQGYLKTLERIKEVSDCEIYGYCLMTNHVHLLIKEIREDIGQIMKRLGISYAHRYNCKYGRSGHVFQDRYKSEPVEDDPYLLTVIRYIHNNPVKAGMVNRPEQYKWSSYITYYSGKEYIPGLIHATFILGLFSEDKKIAMEKFRQFSKRENTDSCLEIEIPVRISDGKLIIEIQKLLKGKAISTLQQMERKERDNILHQAKGIKGSSIRQIARITGIGYNIVIRA
jgi:putative transposase